MANKGGWLCLIVLACLAEIWHAEMTFFAHSGKLSTVAMMLAISAATAVTVPISSAS